MKNRLRFFINLVRLSFSKFKEFWNNENLRFSLSRNFLVYSEIAIFFIVLSCTIKNETQKKALILLSGGLDSCVSAKFAVQNYNCYAIVFDYGQPRREILAAKKIARNLNINSEVIKLPFLKAKTEYEIPEINAEELDNMEVTAETAKAVWIPARNMMFISIAASFAEKMNCSKIFVGLNAEEGATFPDNTWEFVDKFNELLKYGTLKDVEVASPLINCYKGEIIMLGTSLGAPLELSWSCYKNGKYHCGECESCLRRRRGFLRAGVLDLTEYEK